jgi:hypothetical protein
MATLKMAEILVPSTQETQAEAEVRSPSTCAAPSVVKTVLGGGECVAPAAEWGTEAASSARNIWSQVLLFPQAE